MTLTNVLVGIAIAVGLAGIIIPVLPGILLIFGALVVWGFAVGTGTGWAFVAVATLFLVVGSVVKYLIPGKQLKTSGVPNMTLVIGGVVAVVGFFVIPVVGFFIGFPLGVYLAEYRRLGQAAAWPSTKAAIKAVGLSIVIEFIAAVLATFAWIVGLFVV